MLPKEPLALGKTKSCIRELSAYADGRKAEIGKDKVFDFSLGNPSVAPPKAFNDAIIDIVSDPSLSPHSYTPAPGFMGFRKKIADEYNSRFDASMDPNLIFLTQGACPALAASIKAVVNPGETVATLTPFFPEYRVFTEAAGATLLLVPPAANYRVDKAALKEALNSDVRALIINSPNNPTGAILTEDDIRDIALVLKELEKAKGEPVYLISDEPYREIVYGDKEVPSVFKYYDDSIICYSWSKSLSIPGDRLGYVALCPRMKDAGDVIAAIAGASRAIGHVNPPSLMQYAVERCVDLTSDFNEYKTNRMLLTEGLSEIGYEFVEPDGAFYLFMKALEPDAKAFSEKAKKHELMLVPSDDFGVPGYVRIAYCVSKDTVVNSMPAFKALYEEYQG